MFYVADCLSRICTCAFSISVSLPALTLHWYHLHAYPQSISSQRTGLSSAKQEEPPADSAGDAADNYEDDFEDDFDPESDEPDAAADDTIQPPSLDDASDSPEEEHQEENDSMRSDRLASRNSPSARTARPRTELSADMLEVLHSGGKVGGKGNVFLRV